ncbi:MAG: DUF1349 domain-containing protein [Leptolyngbya sp. BL-A-14]
MQWLNEPAAWSSTETRITVKTAPKTDFWRVTHYGFIRDNGHFYFEQVKADFDVEVTLRGSYRDLYDQAGLMLRLDEKHWIKTGIEFVEGIQQLSAVVTNDYSDWSVAPLIPAPASLRLRIERRQETVQIFYANANSNYTLLRLAYFPIAPEIQVGIMCASPEGDGYEVTFDDYRLIQR